MGVKKRKVTDKQFRWQIDQMKKASKEPGYATKAEKWKKDKLYKQHLKKVRKFKDAAAKPAKALARKSAKKSLARKVVGKLGAPGKIAVGASILYHYAKKSGCKPGMSKVKKGGKFYCATSKGSKKGRDY